MANWKYEGLSKEGKRVRGVIDANSEKDARKMLRNQGVRPKKVLAPSLMEIDLQLLLVEKGFARPFGNAELTQFTKQLSIMISAGVPILQSLEILYKQQHNPSLKLAIKQVAAAVGGGKSLFEALSAQKGFTKLYCNLIKAGEAAGILDTILNKLAAFMERNEKIKAQVKGALTYPTIVVIVGVAVVYTMMVFVVPKFAEMLTETGQEMPFITKMVIDISNWLQKYTIYLIPSIFMFLVIFVRSIKTPTGKPIWDQITMKLPLFGGIIIKGNLASFCRTLSTMMSSGIAILDSLDICIDTLENAVMQKDLKVVRQAVTEGRNFTEPLQEIPYFPPMVAQMVKVGEQTGTLDAMLERVADVFENEVNELIGTMTKLIEPLILVGLGGVVAVILVAMYMPIFMAAGGQ